MERSSKRTDLEAVFITKYLGVTMAKDEEQPVLPAIATLNGNQTQL